MRIFSLSEKYVNVKIYYGGIKFRIKRVVGTIGMCTQICIHLPCYWMVKSSLFFILEGLCHTPVAGFLAILSTFLSKRGFQAYSKYTTVINKIDEKGEKSRKPNKRFVSCSMCTF